MIARLRVLLGPLFAVTVFFLSVLVILSVSRIALVLWQWQRVIDADGLWRILGQGVRMDTAIACYLLLLPAILAVLLPTRGRVGNIWRHTQLALLALLGGVLVFMELATPSYIDQYGVRPSRIFLEYLIYPREVFSTLWGAYRSQLIISAGLVIAVVVLIWRYGQRLIATALPWRWHYRLLALPLVVFVMFVGARSSFEHRAANPSTVAFSGDPLVNDLPLSSTFTMLYAAYSTRHESDAEGVYGGDMPVDDVIARVRAAMLVPAGEFIDPRFPTLHRSRPTHRARHPQNLVIIVEESLGARFVGALGGLPLTPELDKLSREGLWFTQLYATGTRSARGLEAIVAGFPPTPATAVLKLSKAQDDFYTLARTLAQQGYTTEFIYGGESHFDNMSGFFLRNGFERVIDERSYPQPVFRGSWGVSDEDLFDRAHDEFLAHGEKPFFALVFSSSFHSPFEFPDGRITLYEQPKNTDHNAVKYADFALGRFFQKAKRTPYWDNTLFLVVADHDARVFGASLVPVDRFRIPGLILGKSIAPARYVKPASQIDLAPTLLSLLGVEAEHPMIGHDLTKLPRHHPGRAIMQYENNHAYLKGDKVVIHEPHQSPRHFRYEHGQLVETSADDDLAQEALAHALWSSLAYHERQYRGPLSRRAPDGF